MKPLLLMMSSVLLVWPQDTEEVRQAIAIVEKANGSVGFDAKAPGKIVVSVNL